MRIICLLAFFVTLSAGCSAENVPAVGLLELVPVVGNDMRVKARPSYVFTNTKLSSPTVFTGLHSNDSSSTTICCFEVTNFDTISIATELSKYSYDQDFVDHIKSIKGYKYVYAIHPTAKNSWNQLMHDITLDTRDPMDARSFSAPVIAATIQKASIPNSFEVNRSKITVRTNYKNDSNLAVYTFVVDGQKTTLSEILPSAE